MKLAIDNTITYDDDPLEYARDTLRRYHRGELRAYAFRIFMKDGSYEDLVDGWTDADKEKARADMLKSFEKQPENCTPSCTQSSASSSAPNSSVPSAVQVVRELFKKKTSTGMNGLRLVQKRQFGT